MSTPEQPTDRSPASMSEQPRTYRPGDEHGGWRLTEQGEWVAISNPEPRAVAARPPWFRRTWIWVALAILLGIGVGAAVGSDTPAPEPAGVTRSVPLYEDEPGWNCRTQGNRVCGTGH